jgi:hypothetical protein
MDSPSERDIIALRHPPNLLRFSGLQIPKPQSATDQKDGNQVGAQVCRDVWRTFGDATLFLIVPDSEPWPQLSGRHIEEEHVGMAQICDWRLVGYYVAK